MGPNEPDPIRSLEAEIAAFEAAIRDLEEQLRTAPPETPQAELERKLWVLRADVGRLKEKLATVRSQEAKGEPEEL